MKSRTGRWAGAAGAVLLTVLLAGCNNVKGVYVCEAGMLDSIRLESGGKAYVSATFFGQKQEKTGTYTVDGDKVSINIGGVANEFTHSKNTLDGGAMVGKCTMK